MNLSPLPLFIVLSIFTTVTAVTVKANVDKFFSHPIKLDFFSQDTSFVAGEDVLVDIFQSGAAGLPDWLHLRHLPESSTAYLYGTPEEKNTPVKETQDKINVQIVSMDTESYKTRTENLIIELYDNPAELLYFVELPLLNISLDSLLEDNNLSQLTVIMRRLWTRGEVMITQVISPSLRSPSRVTVKFGGSKHFSAQLRLLSAHTSSHSCGDPSSGQESTIGGVEKSFMPRFNIDWCRVVLTDLSMDSYKHADMVHTAEVSYLWRTVEFSAPELLGDRAHSLSEDFLACVLVPSSILLLLVLVLSCLMCCGRTGWEKRVRMTPEPQLVRYNSIRRASISLRQLSENRELALSNASRSTSMNAVGSEETQSGGERDKPTRSAPSTLQRKREGSPNAPPPYRPPLAYHSDEN